MTEKSLFWSGIVTGDAGPYTFDRWQELYRIMKLLSPEKEGVFRSAYNKLDASGLSSPISIDTGAAIIYGSFYTNDASLSITIPTPSSSERVDLVVLERDATAATVRLVVVSGTEGAGEPSITQNSAGLWQVVLYKVTIQTDGTIEIIDRRFYLDERRNPNLIGNGAFDNWLYGTTISSPATAADIANKWTLAFDGTGATRTITRETFTVGQEEVLDNPQYHLKFNQSVAGSGGSYNYLAQTLNNNVHELAAKILTLSFWAKADAIITLPSIVINQNFGSGGSSAVSTTIKSSQQIGTTWSKYIYTFEMDNIIGKSIGTDPYTALRMLLPINSTFVFYLSNVKIEYGFEESSGVRLAEYTSKKDIIAGTEWKEVSLPVTTLTPDETDPCSDVTYVNGIPVREFSASAIQYACVTFPFPTGWTGRIKVQVAWLAPDANAGNMFWRLRTRKAASGEVFDTAAYNTIDAANAAPGTLNMLKLSSISSIIDLSSNKNDWIFLSLCRYATDVGDTYGAVAPVVGINIWYEIG